MLLPHDQYRNHCRTHSISFETVEAQSAQFDDILALRELNSGTSDERDQVDDYSFHYVAKVQGAVQATLRVTRHADGELDCEEFLPSRLLAEFGAVTGSAARFNANPAMPLSLKLAHLLVEVAWLDQISTGIRLDIINVHERAVRYYGRLGYHLIADSFFIHPRLLTPSRVMICPAMPTESCSLSHLFEGVSSQLSLDAINSVVDIEPWKTFQKTSITTT